MKRFLIMFFTGVFMVISFQNCSKQNFDGVQSSVTKQSDVSNSQPTLPSVQSCGTCKSLNSAITIFAQNTDSSIFVASGSDIVVNASNRANYNVLVQKGARIVYNDQPSAEKRVYFEGIAKDYSFTKMGNTFKVKDSCGNISAVTVGSDGRLKMIFKDGTQEVSMTSSDGFQLVFQGVLHLMIYLGTDEYLQAGVNYLDITSTSANYFSNCQ